MSDAVRSPRSMPGAPRDLTAQLTFLGDVAGTPTNYFDVEPPAGVPRLYPRVRCDVVVHDARALPRRPAIDREGVVLAEHPGGVIADFRDERALRTVYYPAVERDAVMRRRHAIFNVWRPISGPVEQWPLAVCDMQSLAPGDFVDAELHWPHRAGHVCAIRHRAAQRWLYAPAMDVDEALVFTCYDSVARPGGVRFAAHTAFADPTSPPGARTRESIEVRTIALFA